MQLRIKKKILMDLKRDPGKKYILFLLNSLDKAPIKGKTKFMKELFFISKNVPELESYLEFEQDNYGPNSDKVGNFLSEMSQVGLINLKKENSYYEREVYSLGEYGEEVVKELDLDIDFNLLEDMKKLFDGLTMDESLALTYFTYPSMTGESIVKKRIFNKRKTLALNLYNKDKISAAKASEIAGVSLIIFLNMIKKNGKCMELKY